MYYKVIVEYASRLEYTATEAQAEAKRLRDQLDSLSDSRSEFESGIKVRRMHVEVYQHLTTPDRL